MCLYLQESDSDDDDDEDEDEEAIKKEMRGFVVDEPEEGEDDNAEKDSGYFEPTR